MLQNLISIAFWFNARPEPVGYYGQQFLWSMIAIFSIASIVIAIKAYPEAWHIYKKSLVKLSNFLLGNSLIALYILFVNDQIIPVLRARYWYIIWILISLVWLFFIFKDFKRRNSKRSEAIHNSELKKYLPS
jgi:hypothetical protein